MGMESGNWNRSWRSTTMAINLHYPTSARQTKAQDAAEGAAGGRGSGATHVKETLTRHLW